MNGEYWKINVFSFVYKFGNMKIYLFYLKCAKEIIEL